MGSAIIDAVIQKGLYFPDEIIIVEKSQNLYTKRFATNRVQILESAGDLQGMHELIIIAVNPQDASTVMEAIAAKTDGDSLVISIMAGITLAAMESKYYCSSAKRRACSGQVAGSANLSQPASINRACKWLTSVSASWAKFAMPFWFNNISILGPIPVIRFKLSGRVVGASTGGIGSD